MTSDSFKSRPPLHYTMDHQGDFRAQIAGAAFRNGSFRRALRHRVCRKSSGKTPQFHTYWLTSGRSLAVGQRPPKISGQASSPGSNPGGRIVA